VKKRRRTQNTLLIQSIIYLFLGYIQSAHAQKLTLNIENKVTISVERAKTPEERDRGLMFRGFLSPKHGMLFDFGTTKKVSMWMKNTYISLDILFVSALAKIVQIVSQTTPLSTDPITSKRSVRFVLELPAGTCKKHNIRAGNQILDLAITPEAKHRRHKKTKRHNNKGGLTFVWCSARKRWSEGTPFVGLFFKNGI
jgi:uncharacterized membrane protein (UPF0127 family)